MNGVEFFPKADRTGGQAAVVPSTESTKTRASNKQGAAEKAGSFSGVLDSSRIGAPASAAPAEKAAPVISSKASLIGARTTKTVDGAEIEVVDARRGSKSVLKQQAVLDFMSEMKTQFGVEPEQIVAAFSQLDDEALGGRPEDAMTQFLAQLAIPQDRMSEAQALYQKLVTATGDAELSARLGDGKAVVSLQVLTPEERRTTDLHSSLDRMSDQFFRRGEIVQAGGSDPLAKLGFGEPNRMAGASAPPGTGETGTDMETVADPRFVPVGSKSGEATRSSVDERSTGIGAWLGAGAATGLAAAGALGSSVSAMTAATASTPASTPTSEIPTEMGSSAPLVESDSGAGSPSFEELFADGGGTEQGGFAGNFSGGDGALAGEAGQATFGAGLAGAVGAGAFAKIMGGSRSDGGDEATRNQLGARASDTATDSKTVDAAAMDVHVGESGGALMGVGSSDSSTKGAALGPSSMILEAPRPTPEQKQENINEIIRQAQIVMKRGGGEMKLQLQPEGLGQVNLKVLVQDGQVNVQMMTENDTAKKLLENGLSDLKAQLAAHKLHVETLKVDMQADAGMKKFEQGFGDAQREQARQFASDFLGQFRDERQGFFSSYMDRPNMKGYGRSQKRAAIEPTPADGVNAANSRGRSGDGARRLNLVA